VVGALVEPDVSARVSERPQKIKRKIKISRFLCISAPDAARHARRIAHAGATRIAIVGGFAPLLSHQRRRVFGSVMMPDETAGMKSFAGRMF
jgi:hypothetical protein